MESQNRRLDGWKAIAAHVGRSERTVHRWARERGLPVHHLAGGGSVFAWSNELDEWFLRQRAPEVTAPSADQPPEPATAPPAGDTQGPPQPGTRLSRWTERLGISHITTLVLLVVLTGVVWRDLPARALTQRTRSERAGSVVAAEEAIKYAGQTITVCGRVVAANFVQATRGEPTFLNFEKPYPNQPFMAVIWGMHRARFRSPELAYLQKRICVAGRIDIYQGVAEMVVTTPSAIRVVQ